MRAPPTKLRRKYPTTRACSDRLRFALRMAALADDDREAALYLLIAVKALARPLARLSRKRPK